MLLLSLTVLSLGCQVNSIVPAIFGIAVPGSLQTLWKVAGFVNSLGGKVKKAYDLQKAFTDDGSEKIEEILSKVAEVSDQIGGFESRLTQRLDMMVESLVSRITLTEKLNNAISDVHKNIVNVDEMWSNYLAYSKNLTNFSNNTIKAFIDSATRAHDGLQSWLSQLYGLFIPGRTGPIMESLFTTMLKLEGETALLICDGGLSPQQELYQMYHMAALTELRGFIMAVSAYGLQSTFDGEKYQGEVDIIETRLVSRIQDYILAVTAAMKVASNTIRRCDPKGGHREGHTYIQLHRLFQSYLVNEADIDPQEKCIVITSYSIHYTKLYDNTLKSFIKLATGDQQGGLQKLLNQMHRLVVPLRTQHIRDSLFLTMLKYERETELITCDEPISHQQAIYQIYYSVALTELRGFVMAAYAYGLRPKYENGKYTEEVNSLEARFTMRSRDYLVATKEAMKIASNRIRRCDPKGGHKKGISFVEMDELFQTYIINEADIHPDDSCKETCGSIGTQTYRRKTDSYVNYNYDRPCWGTIRDCRYGGGKMTVCDTRYVTNNSRRYYWFKEDDGTVSGDNSVGCPGQTNWPKGWIRGFYKCDYCICTCEADRKFSRGKRAISFLPSRSDAVNNMVVTGVRVVQKEKMILIQVREGKLQPQGTILKGSDRWVPLPEFQYAQLGSAGGYYLMRGAKKALQVQGRDFEFFKGDKKTVNLDDVSGPPGHVVIGVRFQQAKDAKITKDNPIRLEVLAVPFDFEEGKVTPSRWKPAKWIGVEDNKKRTQVKFNEPDVPTKHGQNLPTLAPNLYVNFQASDLKKDAGQSTIPFWDIQDVITIPSFALQGVGIFHKGHRDGLYGGYLALRLLSLEFADNLNTTVPQDLQNAYEQIYRAPLYTPTGVL